MATTQDQDLQWSLDLVDDQNRQPRRDIATSEGIPATDYATSYVCAWSNPELGIWNEEDLELLRHVNCSYLSSNKPPTLLALKQHALSLVNLIKKVSISSTTGVVDNKGKVSRGKHLQDAKSVFLKNDAFDWLNDLDAPYINWDDSHNLPLTAIANQVKNETEGPRDNTIMFHCPLEPVLDDAVGKLSKVTEENKEPKARPYQTHENLLRHANHCLEILDHEYSSTGGLLSIVPTNQESDSQQMDGVRNTLLGQWLLHHQHLVARIHELEISYANAIDVLEGKAVVPLQMLSGRGLDARSLGRRAAYPQDRFLLVNSGDDVFNQIHRLLDKREAQEQVKEQAWRSSGVSGQRLQATDRHGQEFARGIVSVDVGSRFYRLKGQGAGRGTLFLLPAALDSHPGVEQTRAMEERPTVVSTVTPLWPERVTELQRKHEAQLERGSKAVEMEKVLFEDREKRQKTIVDLLTRVEKADETIKKLEEERDAAATEARQSKKLWNSLRDGLAGLRDVFPPEVREHLDPFLAARIASKDRNDDVGMAGEQ